MTSDKTATERLRELLDERGVEWRRTPHYSYESTDTETVFPGEGIEWIAGDHLNGRVGLHALRYEVTPEQAIAATLGPGTCHEVWLLMATDVGNGREEVLGVYSSEGAAEAAASEDSYGYAFHNVQRWEVDE